MKKSYALIVALVPFLHSPSLIYIWFGKIVSNSSSVELLKPYSLQKNNVFVFSYFLIERTFYEIFITVY